VFAARDCAVSSSFAMAPPTHSLILRLCPTASRPPAASTIHGLPVPLALALEAYSDRLDVDLIREAL
jgi:hypothetical protein